MISTPNFLPSITYFSEICTNETIVWNSEDIYFKQSYRNRANILGANKVESLIVPVHASSGKTLLKDVKIDNHSAWQRTQLRTLEAAYRGSPYFQYYDYLIEILFQKQFNFLVDLQIEAVQICQKCMQWNKPLMWSKPDEMQDILEFSPKKRTNRQVIEYHQTFGEEFVPHLSILDLLFNKGPETSEILINQFTLNTH
ncbi:WbqC family protein [Jiulongibacter sediminis]|uniref:WbqC family protein n=1 Tax=Jiulongibacter sediminis TaxID=1605367 RepID=UPI0026F0A247|nr:WbqC family protein [Jiulongibacter sediminis]